MTETTRGVEQGQTERHAANAPVERLRGMRDVPPAGVLARDAAAARMLATLAQAGYARVDVPVIEPSELFLRRTGEERVQQMYTFRYRNRELALRPEFTASVVRATLAASPAAFPVRAAYCGPVFRYERPGSVRARQFTEIGGELIGAESAAADAEVIALACGALRAAGVEAPRIVIGHVGVARAYLAGLHLDERVRDWLLWSMERLRPDDPDGERIHPALAALIVEQDAAPAIPAPTAAPDRDTFLALLREAGFALDAGNRRTATEIAEGLMRKLARRHEQADIRRALAFLRRLVTLRGLPDAVMPQLETLLAAEGLSGDEARRLREVLTILPAYGIPLDSVLLDLSLGRGLTYYTGVLFQTYAGGPEQLGGGGRYDDLAAILGAPEPLPAVGFSLHLEAVFAASHQPPVPPAPPTVIVATAGDDAAAAALVTRLRALGWVALLDLHGEGEAATPHAVARATPLAGNAGVRWQSRIGGQTVEIAQDDLPAPDRHNEGIRGE